ncbi:MAG: hypothetical protein WCO56_01545 [Verrucomicrobiota bacterium]
MKWNQFTAGVLVLIACSWGLSARAAERPRVAVWNPEQTTREARFIIDLEQLNQVAATLQGAGCAVARITVGQFGDAAIFSADQFDVLVMTGDSVPKTAIPVLKQFTDEGGVLVALAGRIPFLVAIEKEKDGAWTMAPKEPRFAWQTEALLGHLGLHYIYLVGMHDQGVQHTVTPLLKKYLPDAPTIGRQKLTSNFLVPTDGDTEVYPLIRSQRMDGQDVVPQLYLLKHGKARAIIATLDCYFKNSRTELWPASQKTLVAVVQLAGDLRAGKIQLTRDQQITIAQKAPEPLRSRLALGSVEPDKLKPVMRWGKFDGTSFELGESLAADKTLEVAVGGNTILPRALEAGAIVQLAVPELSAGGHFLRVRGAFTATGAGLAVKLGDILLWNELLNYTDAGGNGNIGAPDIQGVAAEFTRIVFLPPSGARSIMVSNPGRNTLYLDAIQLEDDSQPRPERLVGLNGMASFGTKNVVPLELSKQWGSIRANIRTQTILAPDKPNRFKTSEEKLEMYLAAGAPVELLFEGTAEWDAMSAERFKAGGNRSHVVPPDNTKYAEVVEHFVTKYRDRIAGYELWNETNIRQFWQGSYEEYAEFFKTMAAVIRKHQPNAKLITGGMAGYSEPFTITLHEQGVFKQANLFAFHAYAGKSPAWDVPFGMHEGLCFSRGIDTEIYCNEEGFVWQNSEWFQPPPNFTPFVQAKLLNTAMARLLANGLNKLSVFHAGGDKHPYGLIDENGKPRPAYAVMADYFPLGQKGAKRLDVSLTGVDGTPLQGVYSAASSHQDGSATVILNPAEVAALEKREPLGDPSHDFKNLANWVTFFGKSVISNGTVVVTPGADKTYAGFYKPLTVDVDRFPLLEVSVPECDKAWSLSLKTPDKQETKLFVDQQAGVFRKDYRKLLNKHGVFQGELSFRLTGRTQLAYVHFLPDPNAPTTLAATDAPAKTLPIILRVPLARKVTKVLVKRDAITTPAHFISGESGNAFWIEVRLDLSGRTVVVSE